VWSRPRSPAITVRFELLQELVAWFDMKGAATLDVPVTVK
jgi:hypothetical protein